MSTSGLFDLLFEVLAGSPHYMITGSLSFLPLLHGYRAPGQDLDVFIRRDVFEARKRAFEKFGGLHVLRVPEVATADTSPLSWLFAPRTGFVHIETPEGLLDVVTYEEDDMSMSLILGLGVRFSITKEFGSRPDHLQWSHHRYRAAPPEFMFLTKAVGYQAAARKGIGSEFRHTKHHADLFQMARIIDWNFALRLLHSLRITWRHTPLPRSIEKRLNPYAIIDLDALEADLTAQGTADGT